MPLTTTGRNKLLDSGKASTTHIGALTALAPTEVSGGSYARQAITFAAAASGVADNNAQISVPIPASTTVIAVSGYDASTAGNMTFYGGIGSTLRGTGAVEAVGTDAIRSNGHGLVDTDRVFVWAVAGESLPTGLSATTLYFVVSGTTDTFDLSLTSGGASVDITGLGEVGWAKTVPETFSSAGNLVFATGNLDLDATYG